MKNHNIEMIFPLFLFLIFALCALSVLMLTSNLYKKNVDSSVINNEAEIASLYISEKCRQNDVLNGIKVEEIQDTQAIALYQSVEGKEYVTYIYFYDGNLKELFIRVGTNVGLEAGTNIISLENMMINEIAQVIQVGCLDALNHYESIVVAGRTQ